jgi:D-glycero-alpha-D-manno-heptose 1-phosphate guanylyltransferase
LLAANGDSIVLADLAPAFKVLQGNVQDAVIIGRTMEDCSRYGSLECGPDGNILHFNEKRPGAGIINAGIYIFRKKCLEVFPRKNPLSFEFDVFPALLSIGKKIRVIETDAPFIDIGLPETVKLAEAFIKKHHEVSQRRTFR